MPARNDITGDLIRTKTPSKSFLSSIETMSIEERRKNKGKYRWCKEEKRMIPDSEWREKYGNPKPRERKPMLFVNNFEPFKSPVTGNVITNKREHQYDMDSTGSRVYEGRDQEEKEAARYRAYEEQKLESEIDQTLNQTYHEIEHGYRSVE